MDSFEPAFAPENDSPDAQAPAAAEEFVPAAQNARSAAGEVPPQDSPPASGLGGLNADGLLGILQTVLTLFGGSGESAPADTPAQAGGDASAGGAQSAAGGGSSGGTDISVLAGLLQGMMPLLGGQDAPPPSSESAARAVNLLTAIKPYMRPPRAEKIGQAIRMLNTAYSIRGALAAFAAVSEPEEQPVPEDARSV